MTEIIRKNPDETAQWMMSREQSTLLQEGEKMKNESVKHVRYGTGRVAEVVQNHMVVLFDGEAGRKVFAVDINSMLCFKMRQSMVDGNGFYFVIPYKQFTEENAGWENKPRVFKQCGTHREAPLC